MSIESCIGFQNLYVNSDYYWINWVSEGEHFGLLIHNGINDEN